MAAEPTLLQAAVLGAVQGATEFLPVSSSAHLALAPRLFGFADPGLTFDLALHVGTLVSLAAVYGRTWYGLLAGAAREPGGPEAHRLLLLAGATLPAVAAGLGLEDYAETVFRDPRRIAWALIVFSLVMAAAQRLGRGWKTWEEAGWPVIIGVGAAQALAILPGVSRSGVTVSAALLLGLAPASAAELSFLLSAPIIAGAAVFKLRHLTGADLTAPFFVGVVVSALTGLAAVRGFIAFLPKRGLTPFVVYRLALGAALLAAWR
ncbi:MAG: undecaprenyl-diphosphate phosphatase [Elusimicrobiota bacterium]|nr:undecaprenyl-diphosphate phosphatase [Elusimicrobiota bacterium]